MSWEIVKTQSFPNMGESLFWEQARELWSEVQEDDCFDVHFDDPAEAHAQAEAAQYAKAPDGSVLAYTETGDLCGDPVFMMHGTPGSRKGPLPKASLLYRAGIRLITYDRPGYGLSTWGDAERRMRPGDSAVHVAAIADEIGIDKFVVAGRSGGARHALACLAELPDRVMAGGILAGPAPEGIFEDIDQHAGEAAENVETFTVMPDSEKQEKYTRLARQIRKYGGMAMLGYLASQLQPDDRRIIVGHRLVAPLIKTYEEAIRCGSNGWLYDLAGAEDWGFDPENIEQKVKIWHGPDDGTVSTNQAYILDAILRGSILEVPRHGTHFTSFSVTADIIKQVITLASEVSAIHL